MRGMALTDTSGKGVCSQCLSSKGTEEDILMLQCSFCSRFIHTSCLRVEEPPFTTLAGDNFFDLVCSECSRSDDGFDVVRRGRMKVHVAILLALYNLHKNSPRPAQDGFYHWREDIFSYINRHHHLFFPQDQTRIVPASFCATMTKFPQWIESGNSNPLIKGRGYYRLVSVKPPAVLLMQTGTPVGAEGAGSSQRTSFKRGGTASRLPVSRLRSPRTRQNLRDLALEVEAAADLLQQQQQEEDSDLPPPSVPSSSSTSTQNSRVNTTALYSQATNAAATVSVKSEVEDIELKSDTKEHGRVSRARGASYASPRQLPEKRSYGSAESPNVDVLKRRRKGSGPCGQASGTSASPRTRCSPRAALGNSSPLEGNFNWFNTIPVDPHMEKNLEMIFGFDFQGIANLEEVVDSSPTSNRECASARAESRLHNTTTSNRVSISGSPSEHLTLDQHGFQDYSVGNLTPTSSINEDTSGLDIKPSFECNSQSLIDRHLKGKGASNILHNDALRNRFSFSPSRKMSSKNKGQSTTLMSHQTAMDKPHHKALQANDPAMDAADHLPATSSHTTETHVPHKRHKLALKFRENKAPFVLDQQYKADLQFLEKLTPKNLHEEVNLLQRLDDLYKKVGAAKFPMLLIPLRRKLTVRKEQRQHGIGVFNPHAEARSLQERGRCLTNQERMNLDSNNKYGVTGFHLLDLFLKAEEAVPERVWPPDTPFSERLLGTNIRNLKPSTSPYSGKLLPPYYLQLDNYKKPRKLLLNHEIKVHAAMVELTRLYNPNPPPEGSDAVSLPQDAINERLEKIRYAPLHFAPARSEHIPQMNALARQFFWPGINLSDVLKYPEFTCVALYKFMVVGFGVAVPGAGACGEEAYLSFLVVHPEWRGLRIASTILYILSEEISTDITLHVSPSNHAMELYQRFGFKSEEFIKNFYDKYLPEDSPDSKHAFFMRRRRIM